MNFLRSFLVSLSAAALALPIALLAQTNVPEKGGERKMDPALVPVEDVPGLPRVVLIGDSISIGYTLPTRELLKGVANVHRIPVNGTSTDVGLKSLDAWLAAKDKATGQDQTWDVIHFNWGLHDLKHWKDGKLDLAGPQVNDLATYERNLRAIVARLKQTHAKLIFATTTPVPEGSAGRVAGDELKYNEVAERIMKEEGIPVDDLHALAASRLAEIQQPQNVHFTEDGSRVLATQVAAMIRTALGK